MIVIKHHILNINYNLSTFNPGTSIVSHSRFNWPSIDGFFGCPNPTRSNLCISSLCICSIGIEWECSRNVKFIPESCSTCRQLCRFKLLIKLIGKNIKVIANYSKYSFDELAEQGIVRKPINAEPLPLPIQPPPQPPSAAVGTVMTPFGQLQIHGFVFI
jgi:hypothetical protein